jgi:hypothetical protein
VADEPEEKPDAEPPAEPARETAVGHQVVEPEKSEATEVFFSRDEPKAEPAPEPEPAPAPQPAAAPPQPPPGTSPAAADRAAADSQDSFRRKPEVFVAGAFVGAFVIGKLLKKITGGGD